MREEIRREQDEEERKLKEENEEYIKYGYKFLFLV
jgi:hypothetical protein